MPYGNWPDKFLLVIQMSCVRMKSRSERRARIVYRYSRIYNSFERKGGNEEESIEGITGIDGIQTRKRRGMNTLYLSVSEEGEGPPGSCPERFHNWEGGRSGEGAGLANSPAEGRSQ